MLKCLLLRTLDEPAHHFSQGGDVSAIILQYTQELQMLDAYTDYPFEELGDTAGQIAPIRKCTILTWDRNKYCDILVYFVDKDGDLRGHINNIKQFYLYKNEARIDDGEQFSDDELKTLSWTYR